MTFLIIASCLILLILLISWGKLNPFIAFLMVSILAGLLLGIPLPSITQSIQKGIGDMLGSLVIIICLGAMLGKLVAVTGAAQKITDVLVNAFGKRHFHWAMMITGFIVGIPLFYNTGFVLLVPLIFSVVYRTGLPAVYVGLPMLAALSVTHGFLPPHPSPTALVAQFNADMGMTLFYGIIIAIPVILVGGPLFARTVKNIHSVPLKTFQAGLMEESQLPGAFNSFISALLPVLLLIIATALPHVIDFSAQAFTLLQFIGDPVIIMLFSLLVVTFTLGISRNYKMSELMNHYGEAAKDVVLILLIVGGAGALKQVLVDSGVSSTIAGWFSDIEMNPLILGWMIAALIRVCVGSATVAGLTTAGIIAPVLSSTSTDPNLMVLSIGAGSLMFSHVNDAGFWLFKEYFNLSIRDTIRSWSLMETVIAVAGLGGVLIVEMIIR
jgi:Gnt-I system high-affinity gluconate transporter